MSVMESERAYGIAKDVLADGVDIYPWPERRDGLIVGIPTGVRMVHKATGLEVTEDHHRHQYRNARRAAIRLAARVEMERGKGTETP